MMTSCMFNVMSIIIRRFCIGFNENGVQNTCGTIFLVYIIVYFSDEMNVTDLSLNDFDYVTLTEGEFWYNNVHCGDFS